MNNGVKTRITYGKVMIGTVIYKSKDSTRLMATFDHKEAFRAHRQQDVVMFEGEEYLIQRILLGSKSKMVLQKKKIVLI